MNDGSLCKQKSVPCKKEGSTIENTQCGGAKSVDVYLGSSYKGSKSDCQIVGPIILVRLIHTNPSPRASTTLVSTATHQSHTLLLLPRLHQRSLPLPRPLPRLFLPHQLSSLLPLLLNRLLLLQLQPDLATEDTAVRVARLHKLRKSRLLPSRPQPPRPSSSPLRHHSQTALSLLLLQPTRPPLSLPQARRAVLLIRFRLLRLSSLLHPRRAPLPAAMAATATPAVLLPPQLQVL